MALMLWLGIAALTLQVTQDPEIVVKEVRDAYSQVTTARLTVTFEEHDPQGRRLSGTADTAFLRPNHIRTIIKGGKLSSAVYCDGRQIVTVREHDRRATPYSLANLEKEIPLNLETLCFVNYGKELSTSAGGGMYRSTLAVIESVWKDKVWTVIEERNQSDDSTDRYFVGAKDHLIWRVVDMSYDRETTYSDLRVEKLSTGEPVPEDLFEPPKH